jgi:hydroxymethylpyrimidine/phosphomethylpyrimidine kinase
MDLYLVEVPVADWSASVAWYRDRLGLPVILLDEPKKYALLAAGPARVALKQGPARPNGTVLTFHVCDLDTELTRLAGQEIFPRSAVKDSPEGYRVARFTDPDGNQLAIFEWITSNPPPAAGV